ncbi:MAG: serpin family protein [Candidatus Paceibacterota bacterium]
MKKIFLTLLFLGATLPMVTNASVNNDLQAQIQLLLKQVTEIRLKLGNTNNTTTSNTQINNQQGTTSSTCVDLQTNLRYRSLDAQVGGIVSVLQNFLRSTGYLNSEPTGFFGVLTTKAIKDFQKGNDIDPTGFVGPITRAKIKAKSCDSVSQSINVTDDKGSTSTGINSVVNGNNQFALELYSQLKSDDGNIFFSPYSISTALAMVYEGARGKTADEIQSVFHFPTDNNLRRSSFAAIHNQINKPDSKYQLSIANALWAQNDYKFLNDYLTVLLQYYDGKATNVDFKNSTEEARQLINNWVESKTNNKIKDLFPKGSLDSSTRLVLTNAIYFKGTWVKQFEKSQTKDEDFRVSSASTIKVPMMSSTDEKSKFNYTEDDNLQVLEMSYEGNKLSMIVLLPKNDSLSSIENILTLEKINSWRNGLSKQRVNVFMPKFTFDTKYSMNETLKKMGMPTAFDDSNADLSGMDGTRSLVIKTVIHQAFVDVNEEGTEAAAATGVGVSETSVQIPQQPIIFRADHPFIFVIQDNDNGNILFLGRVIDPKK